MKRFKLFAFVIAFALVAGTLFGTAGGTVLFAARDGYNSSPGWWTYAAPGQSTHAFQSKTIDLANADLSSGTSGTSFTFSSTVSNWTLEKDTNALGGVLNTRKFSDWKSDYANSSLSYLSSTPYKNITDPNVFVLTNNLYESTKSKASFTSEAITFNANSYYLVSVDFYAVKASGAFYLIPTETFDNGVNPYIPLTQVSYTSGGWNGIPYYGCTGTCKDGTTNCTDCTDCVDNSGECSRDGIANVAENESLWRTARFYVSTDVLTSSEFKIGLNLGTQDVLSGGVIYFQNPRISQVSHDQYTQSISDNSGELTKTLDFNKPDNIATSENNTYYMNYKSTERLEVYNEKAKEKSTVTSFSGSDFMNPSTEQSGTFARPNISTVEIPHYLNFEEIDYINLANRAGNGYVMMLAANKGNASLKLEKPFIVKRHQTYMISFYTLTADGTSAYTRIRDIRYKDETLPSHITPYNSGLVGIRTSGSDVHNGWTLNTIFITGESYYDTTVDIEFWIGGEDQTATDYMLIDEFQIQRVSSEYHAKFRSTDGIQNLVLDTNEPSASITNAFFNLGTPGSVDVPYPLKADSWTSTYENAKYIASGIVNTEASHWNQYANAGSGKSSNYGIASIRPQSINGQDINNNVYMMQNKASTWQKLSSNSFGLGLGVTTVISFNIERHYQPKQGLNFWVTVETNGRVIAEHDLSIKAIPDGSTNLTPIRWENYSFAIKDSAIKAHEVTLTFHMGTEEKVSGSKMQANKCASSVVYLDNINVTQTDTESAIPSNAKRADLTDTKQFFEAQDSTTTYVGVHGDILTILNNEDTKSTYASDTLGETLTSGTYYEYSFKVKIEDREKFYIHKTDEDGYDITDYDEEYECGVNFGLTEFDGGFTNINAEDILLMPALDADGYTTLKLYAYPTAESKLSLKVSFGNDDMAVTANVFIKDISVSTIEEAAFNTLQLAYESALAAEFDNETNKHDNTKKNSDFRNVALTGELPEPVDDGSSDSSGGSTSASEWWYIVPTIIMAVAILVALIGFLVRKFKFRTHIDKRHTSYAADDRSTRK